MSAYRAGRGSVAIGATLTLDNVAFGGINITDSGAISVSGALTFASGDTISGGTSNSTSTIENSGAITVTTGVILALAGVEISSTGSGSITVDSGAKIAVGSQMVGPSSSIVVSGATFDGGTINNGGTITVGTNTSLTLQDGAKVIGGTLTVNSGTTLYIENGFGSHGATLDDVTVQNSGTIQVDPSVVTTVDLILADGTAISGGTISIGSSGEVEIQHGSGLGPDYGATFDGGLSVNGAITVDTGATLTLNNVTIDGGTVTNNGTVDIAGSSAIDDAQLNGQVTVGSFQTLKLDDTTVTGGTIADLGTIMVDAGQTLTLAGTTAINTGEFSFGTGIHARSDDYNSYESGDQGNYGGPPVAIVNGARIIDVDGGNPTVTLTVYGTYLGNGFYTATELLSAANADIGTLIFAEPTPDQSHPDPTASG